MGKVSKTHIFRFRCKVEKIGVIGAALVSQKQSMMLIVEN